MYNLMLNVAIYCYDKIPNNSSKYQRVKKETK
jgi:hypothetical protein